MASLRTVALVFALLAAASLTAGTTGFSALSAERSVQVAVVEDDQAYVGVDVCDQRGNQGSSDPASTSENAVSASNTVFVHVSNQYTEPIDVSVATDDATVVGSQSRYIEPGERKKLNVKLDDATDSLTVDVTATGFEASITRPVTLSTGCGNGGPSEGDQTGQESTDTDEEADTGRDSDEEDDTESEPTTPDSETPTPEPTTETET